MSTILRLDVNPKPSLPGTGGLRTRQRVRSLEDHTNWIADTILAAPDSKTDHFRALLLRSGPNKVLQGNCQRGFRMLFPA